MLCTNLCVYDEYESPTSPEDHLRVKRGIKEVDLSWKVPDLELYKGTVGNVCK